MNAQERANKVQELVYELKVGDAMAQDLVVVTLDSRMSKLRKVLRDSRISGVPVTEGKKLVGLISMEDFIKWLADGDADCAVKDRMTTHVETLYADEPLVHAVAKFDKSGFGRFPVLARGTGELVGLLTKGNIIESVLRKLEIEYHEEEIHRYRASHLFEDIVADEVTLLMRSHVKSGDFDRAGKASSGLRRSLKRLNVHPHVVRRASIASYEAEMNLVIYTKGGDITVEATPERLRIVVRDSGPGIADIEKVMQPGYSTAPDWVRELGFGAGMGLTNIQKCADRISLTSTVGKGTRLEIEIAMKSE